MGFDIITVAVTGIAALLLVIYAVVRGRERGQVPHWPVEVYLYHNLANPTEEPAASAANFKAKVATAEDVVAYFAAGGSAHGYGAVAEGGDAVGAPHYGAGGLAVMPWPCAALPPVGVWLRGAKPRRGTPGVLPFSCVHWFHPPAR